ncbi:MAG: zinc dependent phospholipase C family protein, partial [Oscillospiraceae bacterium]|nr:zinc dependent phospholipase C family protein [Oscillospiraceae bacterium]
LYGAQGPDLFYYFAVKSPLSGYREVAERIHELNPSSPLEALHDLSERDRERSMLCAFLCGCSTHLALDAAIHPYINARSKEIAKEGRISEECAHVMLEAGYEARDFQRQTDKLPASYKALGDLPHCAAEREAAARGLAMLARLASVDLDENRLCTEQKKLPATLKLLFNENCAVCRFLDAASGLLKKEFPARWHFRRSRPLEKTVMTEADAAELDRLCAEAMSDFLRLIS